MTRRSIIRGVGAWLPDNIVTNDDLSRTLDTSDEWIQQRTGIKRRHVAVDGELTCNLAFRAAQAALGHAGVEASDIDALVLATTTPDHTFPATAVRVQRMLNMRPGTPAWDTQAACSGFVFALNQADNMIRLGQARRILVVGAELMTRILDWTDRSTCVLFGDGAGAIVLEGVPEAEAQGRGILSSVLGADGTYYESLYVDGGVSLKKGPGVIHMDGREVFRHAVERMSEAVQQALALAGLGLDDLTWLVPHQANRRIIVKVGEKLGVPESKVIITVQEHANISSATIPVALAHGVRQNHFHKGDVLALAAMGGGFTWGAAVLRW